MHTYAIFGDTCFGHPGCWHWSRELVVNVVLIFIEADWRYRHAGLMAISAVGEGCHKHMEKHLPQVVSAVIPYLSDDVSLFSNSFAFSIL